MHNIFLTYSQSKKSIILIILTVFLFSLMDAAAKILVDTYPSEQVIWARYMSQTVLSIIVFFPKILKLLATKFLKIQLIRSSFLFFATFFFFSSLKFLQLAEVSAMFQVAPLLVTILSGIFLKEQIKRKTWICVIIGMFGAILIIRPGSEIFSIYIIFPLLAAFCYASYVISTRFLSHEESASTNFLFSSLIGSILASFIVIPNWVPINTSDMFIFSCFGLLGALGHASLIIAYRLSEASFLAPFNYMNLVFACILGYYIFDETPQSYTILGSVIIILSGVYIWIKDRKFS